MGLYNCLNVNRIHHKEEIMQPVYADWEGYYDCCLRRCWNDRYPCILKLLLRIIKSALADWRNTIVHAHGCTHTCTPPFANHNSQSGAARDCSSCQRRRKYVGPCSRWAFYSNHLNNHCALMRKILHIQLPPPNPRLWPGLHILKCSPTEGTNDFAPCQGKW